MNGTFTALRALLALLMASAAVVVAGAMEVRVVRAPAWSPGDTVREGAEEFMILMEVAHLGRDSVRGGLVGIGDRRGRFSPGAERALERAVLHGVPVVKLATNGEVLAAPHGLFLDGRGLPEQETAAVLERCVNRHGALPAIGDRASEAELTTLRGCLARYQQEFSLAASTRLAAR